MSEDRVERRLAAILAADVAGYSRLMGADEEGTLAALRAIRRELADPTIAAHRGRIVKTTGDGLLVEFASVVDALRCAVAVQRDMVLRNVAVPAERRIEFRVGINLGDIIIDDGDIFGDGVNVAARLEALAEPGGICVSRVVRDQVRDKLDFAFEDGGEQQVKNIARPVRVFRVLAQEKPMPEPAALALPDKPSIAVLPFQNMSGDPEQEYFADGIAEDITTALSRVKWFFVIARNSSFTYKGRAVDVKQVGRELGVRYVLEGSVRKGGNRVRITGQLVDALTGAHLWADRFDGALDDIFELQDQVTTSVIGAIEPELRSAEIERARRKPTESLGAYDYYLRALPRVAAFTEPSIDEALQLLREAIVIDPDYALALGLSAWCYTLRRTQRWSTALEQESAEAVRLARAALAQGNDEPTVLAFCAHTFAFLDRDYDAAISLIDRSLALNPNSALAYGISGWIRLYVGALDVALEQCTRSLRLSPLEPLSWAPSGIAYVHLLRRQYDEAARWARRAIQDRPDFLTPHRSLVHALAELGLDQELAVARIRLLDLAPKFTIAIHRAGSPFRDPAVVDFLCEGLRKADMPE